MAARQCTHEGCGNEVLARGLCRKHYLRLWKKVGRVPAMTMEQRFHQKYKKCPDTGCWLWTASLSPGGYGQFGSQGENLKAHRVSFELHHKRPVSEGLYVCHTCDVRHCVNPDHLWEGTFDDNMRDMREKGRGARPKGSSNGRAILDESDVCQILCSDLSYRQLALKYKVSKSTVAMIKQGKSWAHIHKIQAETKN
jgi:hypothetical protein